MYNMTSMTKLDLGKKAAFKSSFANLVKQSMGGAFKTLSVFLAIIKTMLTASFSNHE